MPRGKSGTVAHFALQRLLEHGVQRIYGYPGDGINGFLGAFHESDVEFVQCRHEEIAAFAATGHAKFTGEVGVCMATSGPGAIHLLNGLYDAKLDHQPVVAIVGQQKTFSLGANYQQEVDLQVLFKDVASEFVQYCMHPGQIRQLIDRAVKIAKASRSVTCVIVPEDIQEEKYSDPPREHGVVYTSPDGNLRPRVIPPASEIAKAAEILNSAQKVGILIGQGAAHAADEVIEAADLLGAGVAKALNGRDALPDDLPFVTGSIGLLGTKPSHEMGMNCDCLLMVGTSFPYAEWLPEPGSCKVVEIDIDGRLIGTRLPVDASLVGDSRDTLRELIPHLVRKEDRSWREEIEHEVERWWTILAERAMDDAQPLNPLRVFHELSSRLPDDCILTADSGSATNWWARQLRLRRGMLASLSGTLATMGNSVPYAIAAKFAHPERPVIAFVGDGSFQMNGMNELLTIEKYRERWPDQRLVICVFNNHDLNQVTWEQRVFAGDPKYPATQQIPDFPAARYAELVGLGGRRVEQPDDVASAWDEALAETTPFVLEFVVDPEIPPLPPHVTVEQAEKMAQAMVKGDPEAAGVMSKALRGKLSEFIPGR